MAAMGVDEPYLPCGLCKGHSLTRYVSSQASLKDKVGRNVNAGGFVSSTSVESTEKSKWIEESHNK